MNLQKLNSLSPWIDGLIIGIGSLSFLLSVMGLDWFNWGAGAIFSPFTALSLVLMSISRVAPKLSSTWSKPMTLAFLGIVACGNFSSLWIQIFTPELFLSTMPGVVPTSILTSLGLIAFCLYDTLLTIRSTPESAFIMDDILLHLALFPGGLSLLGHVLGVQAYIGSSFDPRVGIGFLEMFLMACYAFVALVSNPNLFLWRFLSESRLNRMAFLFLFINQYLAPIAVGWMLRPSSLSPASFGMEFYVMLAGVLAVLLFLLINAFTRSL